MGITAEPKIRHEVDAKALPLGEVSIMGDTGASFLSTATLWSKDAPDPIIDMDIGATLNDCNLEVRRRFEVFGEPTTVLGDPPVVSTSDGLQAACKTAMDAYTKLGNAMKKATFDPALKVQAEFGLGAAAHALHKVDPATAGLATRALQDELDKSKEGTDVANTLAALGASGQRELLRVLPKYLHDKSATVRSAAPLALRRIPSDQADALLISMLDSEKSVKVRSDVIHAGRQRVPSEKVMARAERIVRADPASEVRLEGLTVIGAWRRAFPRGRATVTWASKHDQDEKVRAAAREQLAMWGDAP